MKLSSSSTAALASIIIYAHKQVNAENYTTKYIILVGKNKIK